MLIAQEKHIRSFKTWLHLERYQMWFLVWHCCVLLTNERPREVKLLNWFWPTVTTLFNRSYKKCHVLSFENVYDLHFFFKVSFWDFHFWDSGRSRKQAEWGMTCREQATSWFGTWATHLRVNFMEHNLDCKASAPQIKLFLYHIQVISLSLLTLPGALQSDKKN